MSPRVRAVPLALESRQLDLPSLAWCARIDARADRVVLEHGPGVEIRGDAFFEGAWNGDLAAGRFDEATVFSGSGGRTTEAGFLFASATDTVQRLYFLRHRERMVLSNSLALLLVATGEDLDPRHPYYLRDLASIQYGLRRCKKRVRTRAGRWVGFLDHVNATVGADLSLTRSPKPVPGRFSDFEGYVACLSESIACLAANAADPARKRPYRLLATLSAGYDSPTCALLVRGAGCTEAFGFPEARTEYEEFADPDDAGREIGERLGIEVTELDRTAWRVGGGVPEAEFLACGFGGSDVVFLSAESLLAGRILVLGTHGDQVWARRPGSLTPYLVRGGVGGSSFGEFRLRVGFLVLPVPFIGATRVADINAITRSEALRPWRLGGAYDRPIPRRLLEEAGLPRGSFAREKRAIGQPFTAVAGYRKFHDLPLERTLTPGGFASFQAWLARNRHDRRPLERLRFAIAQRLHRVRLPLAPKTRRRLERKGWARLAEPLVADRRYELPITLQDFLTQWAVDEIRPRYAAVQKPPSADGRMQG